MKRGISILAVVTALLLSFALYEALIGAPTERTMGEVQRIFYYHAPSAVTAFAMFLLNFIASVRFLVGRTTSGVRIASWIVIAVAAVVCVATFFVSLPTGLQPTAV